MIGYLVVAKYGGTLLPVALFKTWMEADDFIDTNPEPPAAVLEQFDVFPAEVVEYHVVGFSKGRPVPESDTQMLREMSANLTDAVEKAFPGFFSEGGAA